MRHLFRTLSLAFGLAALAGCSSEDSAGDPAGQGGSAGSADAAAEGSVDGSLSETSAPDGASADAAQEASEPDGTTVDGGSGQPDAEPDAVADAAIEAAPDATDDVASDVQADVPVDTGVDAAPEAAADALADAAEETSSDAGQEASADAANPAPKLELRLDHEWVWTESEKDFVKAECVLVDADGKVLPSPADLAITAPSPAVSKGAATFAWADAGVYPVHCQSSSLGLTTSRDVVVNFEGVDYRFVRTTREVSEIDGVLARIVAANEAHDVTGFQAAVGELKELAGRIPDLAALDMLVANPNGWPTEAQLVGAGFVAGPQDAAWLTSLQALRQAVTHHRSVMSALSTPPTPSDVANVTASWNDTAARLHELQATAPSTLAVWKNMPEVGLLLRELGETTRVRANVMAARFEADPASPPPPPAPPGMKPAFSLLGTLASIAIQEIVGSYTYQSILTDVGKAVVANMISIMIKDLINKDLPANANMPVIDSVHGSAAGFCVAGNSFQVVGSFNPILSRNYIVFIPPTLSNDLSNIVDLVNGINGITQEGNVLKLINQIRGVMQTLKELYAAAWGAGDQFIVLAPDGGDDYIQSYPVLPTGLNCNKFSIPVAGTMIPVDEDWGRGAAINVNVLGEPLANCQ